MRFLSIIAIILLWADVVSGQSDHGNQDQVNVGYGLLSDVQIIAAFADTYSKIASGISGEPLSSDYASTGPFVAGYKFMVSRRVAIGPEVNVVGLKITERYSSGELVKDRFFFLNLSGRFDFLYADRENVQMYSGICLGPSWIFDQSTDPSRDDRSGFFISYQLNFFGVRVGKEWAGYAELGFGRNGLLNFGVSKRL